MDRKMIFLMIAGMALVTYLPRAIPAVLVDKLRFGPKVEKFLKLIPYTAMTALIFPGILSIDTAHPVIGIAGGAAAGALAFRKCPLMACVLAAIAVDFLLYFLLAQ